MSTRAHTFLLLAMMVISTSCANTTETTVVVDPHAPIDVRVKPSTTPNPDQALQFVTPDLVIEPGQEAMHCFVVDWMPEKDYFVRRMTFQQGAGGHHVAIFKTTELDFHGAGTDFDCTQMDQLLTVNPLIVPDTEGSPPMPEGYAVKMPKDTRIVIQTHYVNTQEKAILTSDVVQLELIPQAELSSVNEVSYFIGNVDAEVNVTPGTSSIVKECTALSLYDIEQIKLLVITGHMHEHGTDIRLERIPVGGGPAETLYFKDGWTHEDRDNPQYTSFAPEAAVVIIKGDTMRVTCNYENNEDKTYVFPSEMCSFITFYYPATEGLIFCD